MAWQKLTKIDNNDIRRGSLLKFAFGENDEMVVMMFCEVPNELGKFGLIAITGHKAGINPYFVFADDVVESGLIKDWLINNWQNFALNDDIQNAFVRSYLTADEL
ncbi:MAG: Imm45 family immunity protein [Moraxella sp.]|nr:Imm45 family immunity protein [Moraxella sp.]